MTASRHFSIRTALRWGGSALVILAAAFAAASLGRSQAPQAALSQSNGADGGADHDGMIMISPADERRIGLTYAQVTAQPVAREIRAVGQVVAPEGAVQDVTLKFDGWVDSLHVNFTGQTVHRGEPLFAIYSPMVMTAEEELVLARRLADRVAQGSDEARQGAAALVSGARQRLGNWDIAAADIAAVESTGVARRTVAMRAPATGVVIRKDVVAGQRVMAGESLYQIADLRSVWVEGSLFEQDLGAVHVGQQVQATFDALPGVVRTGRVSFIDPVVAPDTRTARMRVVLDNGDLALKPGMFATLTAQAPVGDHALSVPRSAVLSTGQRHIVFVLEPDGMLMAREVTVGWSNADRTSILRGLAPGDSVVATATFLVDAESNLGQAVHNMAGMPGMDMGAPAPASTGKTPPAPTHVHH